MWVSKKDLKVGRLYRPKCDSSWYDFGKISVMLWETQQQTISEMEHFDNSARVGKEIEITNSSKIDFLILENADPFEVKVLSGDKVGWVEPNGCVYEKRTACGVAGTPTRVVLFWEECTNGFT